MTKALTLLAGLMVLTLPLVWDLPAQSIAGSGRAMAADGARDPGPIERPRKLPGGKLIGDTLYCIVLPALGINDDEPTVDWEYGLWKYSVKNTGEVPGTFFSGLTSPPKGTKRREIAEPPPELR